jgi:hypothetical protein
LGQKDGVNGAGSSSLPPLPFSLWLNIEVLLLFFDVASRCLSDTFLLVRKIERARIKGEGDGRGHNK